MYIIFLKDYIKIHILNIKSGLLLYNLTVVISIVFRFQIELAEEFKFDHDLSLDIVYDDITKPEVILELGDPKKGIC